MQTSVFGLIHRYCGPGGNNITALKDHGCGTVSYCFLVFLVIYLCGVILPDSPGLVGFRWSSGTVHCVVGLNKEFKAK